MYGKFNEANERVKRLDEEALSEQEWREGEPPEKTLGERLRGWLGGRKDQPAQGHDGESH